MSARVLTIAACAAWSMIALPFARSQTARVPSVLAGAYSEAQAVRGQELYYTHCLACHGEDMAGLDRAPPLAGPQFSGVWSGESLWALLGRIAAMPPTEPGKLSREETVAVLAYMLWYNGLPIGEASLGTEQSVLAEMPFRLPPPGE